MFSEPKIYDAKGDLSKRWYVYFYYRNPETGKMKKQKPIFNGKVLKSFKKGEVYTNSI
jgi:hypothetical protein